jgi:predicted transcriptional regulator
MPDGADQSIRFQKAVVTQQGQQVRLVINDGVLVIELDAAGEEATIYYTNSQGLDMTLNGTVDRDDEGRIRVDSVENLPFWFACQLG